MQIWKIVLKVIFVVNYRRICSERVTNWMLFLLYVNSQSDQKKVSIELLKLYEG